MNQHEELDTHFGKIIKMPKTTLKDLEIINISRKGGNDADLLLFDRLNKLEDKMEKHMESMNMMMATHQKDMMEMVHEMMTEMKKEMPNLDDVLKSVRGQDGKDGEDSTIPGPKGERGVQGPPGKDGEDGRDAPALKEILEAVVPLIPKPKDGVDGKPADEEKIVEKVEKDLPKLGEPIRDALELLKGDERLDKKAIKGLEEELKKVSEEKGRTIVRGGMGNANVVQWIDLSAQLNGSTKTFYLGGTHLGILLAIGSSAPFIFRPTVDYTESGANIVFDAAIDATIALAAGQSLVVLFKKRGI